MRYEKVVFIIMVLVWFILADVFGARYIARNSVSQHVIFSSRADRYPNVWPFEWFLAPSHKL